MKRIASSAIVKNVEKSRTRNTVTRMPAPLLESIPLQASTTLMEARIPNANQTSTIHCLRLAGSDCNSDAYCER